MKQAERRYWLDDPRNARRPVYGLAAVCLLLVAIEPFFDKHPHFFFEGWWGFHGFFGFAGFFLLVMAGKHLRRILMPEGRWSELTLAADLGRSIGENVDRIDYPRRLERALPGRRW